MIVKISALLRKMLDDTDNKYHLIQDELSYLEDHIEIEKERFHDRLEVHLHIEEETKTELIPPLLLQPLIENAFKHGLAKVEGKGIISIDIQNEEENVLIEIKNTAIPNSEQILPGVGIKNLMDRLEHMDPALLNKYCLRGVRSQSGFFRVDEKLRSRVRFEQVNLMKALPSAVGKFDVVFLRNVLIYFDQATKKHVVERVASALKPGGHFFISHSESLHRVTDHLEMVKPSVFIKK